MFQVMHNNTREQFEIAEMPENNCTVCTDIRNIGIIRSIKYLIIFIVVLVSITAVISLISFFVVFKSTPNEQFFNTISPISNNAATTVSTVSSSFQQAILTVSTFQASVRAVRRLLKHLLTRWLAARSSRTGAMH